MSRLISLVVVCLIPTLAQADGGAVRFSGRAGNYQVAVFTAPTPWRAGPVDVSVLVQDSETGQPVPEPAVTVRLIATGSSLPGLTAPASRAAATNKLFQAALLDLPAPGRWRVTVDVDGGRGPAQVAFELDAAGPLPRWGELAGWVAFPLVPVALFCVHRMLVRRSHGRRRP